MAVATRDRSTTDYAVLGMLTLRPMSGYDIRATIAESVAYFWTESYGQIYPTLKRLTKERLVTRRSERSGGRERHIYAITAEGREALAEWIVRPAQPRPPRNELLFKLFFARHVPPAEAAAQVERFRAEQERAVARFRAVEQELYDRHANNPDLAYWLITLRYGQLEAEALLRWSAEAGEILQELNAAAAPRGTRGEK
ncbi:MAG: PadR family transcriptional regulator [Candidatus Koribacter versatilis]|uniref:PadR family transcriptional regulator n=1 Tax=Candidatus Korobacter versatilis TaxID=658062 RepID=A0A932A7Z5_9BACT|nr:PadR family transcriptional regulator [Candidatus Koribacter versatilis]